MYGRMSIYCATTTCRIWMKATFLSDKLIVGGPHELKENWIGPTSRRTCLMSPVSPVVIRIELFGTRLNSKKFNSIKITYSNRVRLIYITRYVIKSSILTNLVDTTRLGTRLKLIYDTFLYLLRNLLVKYSNRMMKININNHKLLY